AVSLPIAAIELVEFACGAKPTDREVGEGPDALEIGRRLLRDRRRPLRSGAAAPVVQLECVDPGDPQVGERQVGRGTMLLEHVSGALELAEGGVRLIELPAAAAEMEPRPRRLEC